MTFPYDFTKEKISIRENIQKIDLFLEKSNKLRTEEQIPPSIFPFIIEPGNRNGSGTLSKGISMLLKNNEEEKGNVQKYSDEINLYFN